MDTLRIDKKHVLTLNYFNKLNSGTTRKRYAQAITFKTPGEKKKQQRGDPKHENISSFALPIWRTGMGFVKINWGGGGSSTCLA